MLFPCIFQSQLSNSNSVSKSFYQGKVTFPGPGVQRLLSSSQEDSKECLRCDSVQPWNLSKGWHPSPPRLSFQAIVVVDTAVEMFPFRRDLCDIRLCHCNRSCNTVIIGGYSQISANCIQACIICSLTFRIDLYIQCGSDYWDGWIYSCPALSCRWLQRKLLLVISFAYLPLVRLQLGRSHLCTWQTNSYILTQQLNVQICFTFW